MNARLLRGAALGLVLGFALAGCGPANGTVTGTVTHKGKKVVWGSVSLYAGNGVQYADQIKPDGTFTIMNVPGGICKITVTSPNPEASMRGGGGDLGGESKTSPVPKGAWFALPEKYADPEKSGLTGKVDGKTTIDLDLP